MKYCTKCKELKDECDFGKRKRSKDGMQSWCKACLNKNNKKWYNDNKKEVKDRSKKYYQDNKLSKNKKGMEHYYKNKDYYRKIRKNWYLNNIEKVNIDLKSSIIYNSGYKEELELYEKVKESPDGNLMCKCAYCGEWFEPTKRQVQSRLLAINGEVGGENRLYCSKQCKISCPIYKKIKYPADYTISTSREVQPELRQMVFERDNYTCQKCNIHKNNLDVGIHCHHKEGVLWEPIESADMDMCITLCETCHIKVHKIDGCRYNDLKCA